MERSQAGFYFRRDNVRDWVFCTDKGDVNGD